MGLIKAAISAVGGTLADQWKEYFYCEAMASDVLVQKASKRVNGKSSNTKGSDNVITQGSGIAVADGQCMIIVENGKILDVCAEPGEYTFNISGEPSIFAGDLGTSIKETLSSIGDRIAHGGQASTDTRVYYFNTKEIVGNKYGTPSPVPFRVVDANIGLDIDVSIRCNGEYTYKIVDPLLFYT
ncbi:MAG: SPFH domain-containing protein, partial [Oscillospiraceae bacterium]|nr:SPFH domain-containing protein [Oscillospiraceae bacterium]